MTIKTKMRVCRYRQSWLIYRTRTLLSSARLLHRTFRPTVSAFTFAMEKPNFPVDADPSCARRMHPCIKLK